MTATNVAAAIPKRLSPLGVPIQKLVDQPARLKFVERLNFRAEHFGSEAIECVLVEVVFLSDLLDQFPLFLRAVPRPVFIRFHAVPVRWDKASLLDLLIDCLLQ